MPRGTAKAKGRPQQALRPDDDDELSFSESVEEDAEGDDDVMDPNFKPQLKDDDDSVEEYEEETAPTPRKVLKMVIKTPAKEPQQQKTEPKIKVKVDNKPKSKWWTEGERIALLKQAIKDQQLHSQHTRNNNRKEKERANDALRGEC